MEEKRELIRRYEQYTTSLITARVIAKPELKLWMILVDELVRRAYSQRSTFLMVMNQLSDAEEAFNTALEPTLVEEVSDAHDVIRSIERHTRELRREMADQIYSSG